MASVVWWLVLIAIAVTIMIFVINLCFLVHFIHSDDAPMNTQWCPKIWVIIGLSLVWFAVLLLPFDVATRNAGGATLDDLWYAIYSMMALVAFCIAPFWLCFYEMADDYEPNLKKQFIWGGVYLVCFVVITGVFMGIFYGVLGFVDLTLREMTGTTANLTFFTDTGAITTPVADKAVTASVSVGVKFRTTFFVYVIAVTAFIGWLFFTCFGGIGFMALPMDMIKAFITRPKVTDLQTYHRMKNSLKDQAELLRNMAQELEAGKAKGSKKYTRDFNKLRSHLYFLESDWKALQLAKEHRGKSICIAWTKLFIGVMAIIWTVVWFLHILMAMLLPDSIRVPFLNTVMIAFDDYIPFLGVAVYSLFVFYLLWTVLHGHLKFGFRVLFVPIHPMKVNGTPMNSFLFNIMILLTTAVAVVQFVATAFRDYVRLTAGDNIFHQIEDLQLFGWFYSNNVFIYIMFFVSAVALVYLCIRHTDKSKVDMLRATGRFGKSPTNAPLKGKNGEDVEMTVNPASTTGKKGKSGGESKAAAAEPAPVASSSGGDDWKDMLSKGKNKVAMAGAKAVISSKLGK